MNVDGQWIDILLSYVPYHYVEIDKKSLRSHKKKIVKLITCKKKKTISWTNHSKIEAQKKKYRLVFGVSNPQWLESIK